MGCEGGLGSCVVLLATAALGCSPTAVVTYSHCPVPVMLSPIDRVGAQRPVATQDTGKRDVLTASTGYTERTSQSQHWTYTWTETTGPMALTLEALRLAPNRVDVGASDILVDGVFTGTFMTVGYTKIWGDPKGRKVWLK